MHSTLTPPRRRTIEMLFKSLTAAALCLATLGTAAGFTISPVQLPSARLGLRPAARLPVGSSISARPSSRIAPAGGLAMQGGEKHPLHGALDKVIDDFSVRSDSFLLRAPEPLLPAAVICIPLRLCWNENGGPPRHGLMLPLRSPASGAHGVPASIVVFDKG
jgi:hypothetical protein